MEQRIGFFTILDSIGFQKHQSHIFYTSGLELISFNPLFLFLFSSLSLKDLLYLALTTQDQTV